MLIGIAMLAAALNAASAGGEETLFKPGEVRVRGEIGRRMDRTADYIRKIDIEKTYVSHFRTRLAQPKIWAGFAGWGMMLDAIVKAAAHGVGGEDFRAFKDKWVAETLKCQAADGSISMWQGKVGMWDNHEQAYLIQAFCRDWTWFGNRASLEGARRLGDYILARDIGVNLGLSSAFVYLYRATGDARYADRLRDRHRIEADNDAYDAVLPVNGVTHVYTWLERALSQLEYAAATGRRSPTYDASTRECFRRLAAGHASVSGSLTGGIAWGEIWDDREIGLGKWGETCASAYLMRLAAEWMKTNPDTVLGDIYERVMYNAFFGAQNHDGTKYRYFIPFNEPGEWFERDTYCCPNNFRREIFEIPDSVFLRRPDGFAVNLFAPATLKTQGLDVEMTTDYPRDGHVRLVIRSERAGVVRVRVPHWTGLADAGTWRRYAYGAGETKVAWAFPMAIRAIAGRKAQAGRVALMRGPVVYAYPRKDGEWAGTSDVFEIDSDQAFRWTGEGIEVGGVFNHLHHLPGRLTFVPFASDHRQRTYFPLRGCGLRPVADELFAPRAAGGGVEVSVDDPFWSPRFALWRTNTIYDVFAKFETNSHALANFDLVAQGARTGHRGHAFYDGLVCESIRGASDYLRHWPDAKLDRLLDGVIDRVVAAQRPDGYLHTYVQLGHERQQWGDNGGSTLSQHEIYNAGCLIEAGVHHYRATGKTKLLDAAIRFANLLCDTIGPRPRRNLIPAHSLAEEALVKLSRLTRDMSARERATLAARPRPDDYLRLVRFWFEAHGDNCGQPDWPGLLATEGFRGVHEEIRRLTKSPHDAGWRYSLWDYQMDAKPLREYRSIEGHAVRAALLDVGLAAYAHETGDAETRAWAERFWRSMTGRKMYVSGGVGAKADLERFAADYELPPDAYLETCAAVASAFASGCLAASAEDGVYMDEFERVLYNALLTAVGRDGCTYTYQNPLNTQKGTRWAWHGCPCCPPMFLKFTGQLPDCIYRVDARGVRVDLFMGSQVTFAQAGTGVRVRQFTRYPDDGRVDIAVTPDRPVAFRLSVRVPGWARGEENHSGLYACDRPLAWSLSLNGTRLAATLQRGYAVLEREWRAGDVVTLQTDVSPRKVRADPRVKAVRGLTAEMRGPVLMAEERGRIIPYWNVANDGPAPHAVWR